MSDEEFSEHVEKPLIWEFLKDNLSEFVKDVQVFSEGILANVPIENKPFIKSAGLAFYSAAILDREDEDDFWPILSIRSAGTTENRPMDKPAK